MWLSTASCVALSHQPYERRRRIRSNPCRPPPQQRIGRCKSRPPRRLEVTVAAEVIIGFVRVQAAMIPHRRDLVAPVVAFVVAFVGDDSLGSEAVRFSKMFHADEAPTCVPGAGRDEGCRRRRRCRVSVARKRGALPRCLREACRLDFAGIRCPDTYVRAVPKATTDAQAAEPSQRRRLITVRGGTIGYEVLALSSEDDSDRRMIGARSVLGN